VVTYADLVRTHLHGRRLLRGSDERRLLRVGVEGYGLDMASAQRHLAAETTRAGIARQADVDSATRALLAARPQRGGRAGRVSSAEFERLGAFYRARAGGQIPQDEVNSRVKRLMVEAGLEPRAEGWWWRTRGWFDRIPDQPSTATTAGSVGPELTADALATRPAAPARAVLRAWVERANALDLNGVTALYDPRALLLATATPDPRQGPAAIRAYFQTLLAHPRFAVRLGPELAAVGNDPVTLSGLYDFSWVDAQGQPLVIPARYTVVITHPRGSREGTEATAPVGAILQHHSSSLPTPPGSAQV